MPSVDNSWSSTSLVPTQQQRYLWKFEYIYYSDGSVEVTDPVNLSIAGADADTTGITEELDKTKQELTAKIEKAQNDSLAAVDEAKQEITTVANDLSQAKQDLTNQAQQLQAQANAQSELTKRVSSVEKTADGTKTTVSELTKTVAQNGKDITSVTARTKVVEDDLTSTKTTLTQVQTTADGASSKAATLETGLNGVKADLTATTATANTTKTNLANYQASNDKVVASLKSSLQTTDGNVSNLQTKVEAVPGQITSAVSAVEGKIPTEIGTVNLLKNSKSFKGSNIGGSGTILSETYQGCAVRHLKVTGEVAIAEFIRCVYPKLGSEYAASFWAKGRGVLRVYFHGDSGYLEVASGLTSEGNATNRGDGSISFNLTSSWKRYWVKYKMKSEPASATSVGKHLLFRTPPNGSENEVYLAGVKLEEGNVASGYEPAPEDTISQIDAVSSELKQTKDGITLLATKTELNSAKTELQSGINTATSKAETAQSTANNNAQTISTHTTQISALNTGLQAKVSQTDFNTLSGRVTTAENNITAKANELSSKITSVEGKIPTEIGTVNLLKNSKSFKGSNIGGSGTILSETYQGCAVRHLKVTGEVAVAEFVNCVYPKLGGEYVASFWAKGNGKFRVYFWGDSGYLEVASGLTSEGNATNRGDGSISFNLTADWKRYWVKYKLKSEPASATNVGKHLLFRTSPNGSENEVYLAGVKLEEGNVASGYEPAPEDTISQIDAVSSELKQTKDGITLLATKTELNTAKNDLQSGINTATNKANNAQSTANSAQSTANNNAQTISTHTTQISALNTGLQAKVSQTDFNTLSGRVTTAENNITAKANELSSKITSVEGKIPTSSGGRNLAQGTSKDWSKPFTNFKGTENTCPDLYKVLIDGLSVGDTLKSRIVLKYTDIIPASGKTATIRLHGSGNVTGWGSGAYSPSNMKTISGSGEVVIEHEFKITADHLKNSYWYWAFRTDWIASGSLQWRLAKAERGMFFTDWSPAPEDAINQINSVSSEFKQTTDSIKASVTSLDKSTVKSSSLTINSDGIVMKAGKSTTDVANAIGSYFAVNQNAIDLFADKINVKGSMIVDGAITGDKIKANSVDVTKIVGIDADFIKSKIEYAMIDWLKGKTITAYNDNMTIDLQDGRISFKDGSNAVYRQTPDGIHTGFLHFEAGSQGGIYAAFGATSTRQGINSKSSEFAGIRCYRVSADGDSHDAKVDKIEVIGDAIQFGHGYESDGQIGGGFIMDTAVFGDDTPYSLNRVIKSIEALWRILHDHAKNTGYRFNDSAFINAINNEYNTWHDMHNI